MPHHHTRSVHDYLPAAGHDLLLPLYDPLTALLGMGRARRALLSQGELEPHMRVLDIGCGTGSFLLLLAQHAPEVAAVGLDPDEKALARARAKLARAAARSTQLSQGYAGALPYEDASFDRVFSSFMFHHLEQPQQSDMLREAARVLKPAGRLELLDFAGHDHAHPGALRLFHSQDRLAGNRAQSVLDAMRAAGFASARVVRSEGRLFPSVYYQAQK